MNGITAFKHEGHDSILNDSSSDDEEPWAREQAIALAHMPGDLSPAADLTPLHERRVCSPFSRSFDLQAALEKATGASEQEKRLLLDEASRAYVSCWEKMTFKEVTSFWKFVRICSPCQFPIALSMSHLQCLTQLLAGHMHAVDDKKEVVSLVRSLCQLYADRQLVFEMSEIAFANRVPTSDLKPLLAELILLFGLSLKPEEGREWDADRIEFLMLVVELVDSDFKTNLYRIVYNGAILFQTCGLIEVCTRLFSLRPTMPLLSAFGYMIQYMPDYRIPHGFDRQLWKFAESLDLPSVSSVQNMLSVKHALVGLFHRAKREPDCCELGSLEGPISFLNKWAALLKRPEFAKERELILKWLCHSCDFPLIWSELRSNYQDRVDINFLALICLLHPQIEIEQEAIYKAIDFDLPNRFSTAIVLLCKDVPKDALMSWELDRTFAVIWDYDDILNDWRYVALMKVVAQKYSKLFETLWKYIDRNISHTDPRHWFAACHMTYPINFNLRMSFFAHLAPLMHQHYPEEFTRFMLDLAATPAIHYQSLCLFASLAEQNLLHDPEFPQLIADVLERIHFKSLQISAHPIHCTKLTLLKAISTLYHRGFLYQPSPKALQAVKTLMRDPQTGWLYPFAQEDREMLTQLIAAWDLAKDEPALQALCDSKLSYKSLTFHPQKRPLGKLL